MAGEQVEGPARGILHLYSLHGHERSNTPDNTEETKNDQERESSGITVFTVFSESRENDQVQRGRRNFVSRKNAWKTGRHLCSK